MLYDALAGREGLGKTTFLDRNRTLAALPTVRAEGLRGGVQYWDGQFDDARLALALARTASRLGACVANYMPATSLVREGVRITGVRVQDAESGQRFELKTRCVVNATGVWVDEVRRLDNPGAPRMVTASQGVHLVVHRDFLPGDHALLVPRTADGRVLFVIPWLGKTLLGTTDTPGRERAVEPRPLEKEVAFILEEASRCLARAPTRGDVLSVWVGLRPLVQPVHSSERKTKNLSREHTVEVSKFGLVTVTGGKWTTYRAMAEDVLEECFHAGLLARREGGVTESLPLVGAVATGVPISAAPGPHLYGSEAEELAALPGADRELAPGFTEAMVRFAVRAEYARSVEDVLGRRSRLLFLDAKLAASLARAVAAILVEESEGFDAAASAHDFEQLAAQYQLAP
jgi:glycerol-3-phosphate dehydrogenase